MALVERMHRPTQNERITTLEQRADKHDVMAGQVDEMYAVFDLSRKIGRALNRASVKISAIALGLLGAVAAVLTVIEKLGTLFGHH